MSSLPIAQNLDFKVDDDGVFLIQFNRPEKKNSLFPQVFKELTNALEWSAQQSHIKIVVLTGSGQFYSSGIELTLLPQQFKSEQEKTDLLNAYQVQVYYAKTFIDTLISFPKILIAAVNGPVLGIACTTLALFDFVYCSDDAYFMTPFMDVALCAEGCSSVLFPRILGPIRANEMLFMGKKFKAQDMLQYGYVNQVYPKSELLEQSISKAKKLATYEHSTLSSTKKLIKNEEYQKELLKVNDEEFKVLFQKLISKEHANAVKRFYARKNNPKL